jgi:hypothetical protein
MDASPEFPIHFLNIYIYTTLRAFRTSGRIQTENYGFKVFAVPSALFNGFSGHFTV